MEQQRKRKPVRGESQKFGYCWQATGVELSNQIAALRGGGCDVGNIYIERAVTHRSKKRPALANLKRAVRPGDVVAFVSFFDAIAGFREMLEFLEWTRRHKIMLLFVRDQIDTRTPLGRLAVAAHELHLHNRLAEVRSTTKHGLAAARLQGKIGGRPAALTAEASAQATELIAGGATMMEVAVALGVSRATLYNAGLTAKKNGPPGRAAQKMASSVDDRLRTRRR